MTRYNNYVVREYVEDECGCGTYRESQYRVPEEDCGCQEALSAGDRVRLRYDRFGNAWIVSGQEASDCGPRYGSQEPYRGVYLGKKEENKEEKQSGACTE